MSRVLPLLRHDMRLMWRYGIYPAYLFVILVTVVVMLNLGHMMPDWLIALAVFSDYAALGYLFLGGMMMLERSEDTRIALAMTPVSGAEYLFSKTAALIMVVMIMSVILASASGRAVEWPLYLVSVLLVSLFYIGLGAFLATKFKTITGYIIGAALMLLPVFAPCWLALMDPMPAALAVLPAVAQLKLLIVALNGAEASAGQVAFMLAVSTFVAAGSLWFGARALTREFGRK